MALGSTGQATNKEFSEDISWMTNLVPCATTLILPLKMLRDHSPAMWPDARAEGGI